jgi:fumarate reductase subunit C
MNTPANLALPIGGAARLRKSRWPARLDVAQSLSGLALALFMWVHMLFVSSILISEDAMWTVAKFFEGLFHLRPRLSRASCRLVVGVVFVLFIAHAALALRKFPPTMRSTARSASTWARCGTRTRRCGSGRS